MVAKSVYACRTRQKNLHNIKTPADGAEVYYQWVQKMFIGLEQVGAHYAISSIFDTG